MIDRHPWVIVVGVLAFFGLLFLLFGPPEATGPCIEEQIVMMPSGQPGQMIPMPMCTRYGPAQ